MQYSGHLIKKKKQKKNASTKLEYVLVQLTVQGNRLFPERMILWYADENRICRPLAYGEHGLIKKRYSNMEQIINDWQRDGGSKPISSGNLNKHSWPYFRIGFSLWGGR